MQLGVDEVGDAPRPVLGVSEQRAQQAGTEGDPKDKTERVRRRHRGDHRLNFALLERYDASRSDERFEPGVYGPLPLSAATNDSMRPGRVVVPAAWSRAATSVVFPTVL